MQKIPGFDGTIPDRLRVYLAQSSVPLPSSSGGLSLVDRLIEVGPVHLPNLVKPGMRVMIAFTDATRACPDELLVGWLLAQLVKLGVNPADITLLCATGLHRPPTSAERLSKLGPVIVEQYPIVDHHGMNPVELIHLGELDGVGPVVVNRRCVETDLLLATGVVEPHQYAGYSGGAKTVVIGCGGEATIEATHGPRMLDQPGVRLGTIEGNPFQAFVRRAGQRVGLAYVVNVVLDEAGHILVTAAGEPSAVHNHLVRQARLIYETPVDRPAHLALAGVNAAKAVNLYQACRAATYLALAEQTPLRPGAPILLPAPIPEGAGQGTGEQRFFDMLRQAGSPARLIAELRQSGFPAGAQRAYMLAQTLVNHPVIVIGALHPEVVRACHMQAAPDLASGLALAEKLARRHFGLTEVQPLDFLVIPNALLTLPKLRE